MDNIKRVVLQFEDGVVKTHFEGDWTGRDIYVALRQLEKGYRAYQAQRRKAAQESTAMEGTEGERRWESESSSTSSGSQTTQERTSLSSPKVTLSSHRLLQAKK